MLIPSSRFSTAWRAAGRNAFLCPWFGPQAMEIVQRGAELAGRISPVRRHIIVLMVLIVGVMVVGSVPSIGTAAPPPVTWSQQLTTTSPSPRELPAVAYDPATSQVVLFGGRGPGGDLNDTWVWNGTSWRQVRPSTSPSARYGASLAYDAATGQLLLFGGSDYLNDTWVWTGSNWQQLNPPTSPPGRGVAAMAYYPPLGQMVLFGGGNFGVPGGVLGDTWIWDGTIWSQMSPSTSPSAREGAAMAYDAAAQDLLLFGDLNGKNDTWHWTGSTWTRAIPSTSPGAPLGVVMAYDSQSNQALLLGEFIYGNTSTVQTWQWTGSTWNLLNPPSNPTGSAADPSYDLTMAYDDAANQIVVVIGGSTWLWTGTTWNPPSRTTPPGRSGAAIAYDGATGQTVLFGGCCYGSSGVGNDTWLWTGATWNEVNPATSPSPRANALMAYDEATRQLVLFGGGGSRTTLNDTWVWTGNTWNQLSPTTSPASSGTAMAYDPSTKNIVLFGCGTTRNDTWIWDGTTWNQMRPSSVPPGGSPAAMAYDSTHGQLVLLDPGGPIGTWLWDGTNWSQPSLPTDPSSRIAVGLADDPASRELVLFGGIIGSGTLLGDTWVWSGTAWNQVNPVASPMNRDGPSMVYDPVTSQLVLFGGFGGLYLSDTWTYGTVQAPSINSSSSATFLAGSGNLFTVTTTGYPRPMITETGALPNGMSFVDNQNGVATLSGIPQSTTGGVYPVTIGASNGLTQDTSQSFTLTVDEAPSFMSANRVFFAVGTVQSFTVKTNGYPKPQLSLMGPLPGGVSFSDNHDGTATLSGMAAAGTTGSYAVIIVARNGLGPDAAQNLTLTVDQAPVISSAATAAFTAGKAGQFTVTSGGKPTPSLSAAGTLPAGVTFVDNHDGTATFRGTPLTGAAAAYRLTIRASNGVSPDATQSFTLIVSAPVQRVYLPSIFTTCPSCSS